MTKERVPVWASPKKSILDQLLSLMMRIAVTGLAISLMILSWMLWKLIGPIPFDTVALLIIGSIFAVVLIVWVPKLQILFVKFSSTVDRFAAENEARRTVATIVAGLAIFISFYTAQQQLGLQQQGQFTDRYTKAIDELAASDNNGTPKLAVRLGGIYALEQIMNSSEQHHFSILEVLCLYIRENSLQSILKPKNGPRADVRIALTALGRRNMDLEAGGARSGWRMMMFIFRGHPLLDVIGGEALKPRLDFSGSDLSGSLLNNLILPEADFSDTHLHGCTALFADFQGASFNSADLSSCMIASQLAGASFTDANLEGAIITGKVSKGALNNARVALSCWVGAEFENTRDIKAAKSWENAFYADRDLVVLGLPPDHNLKLVRSLLARYPALPPDGRLLVARVFEGLRNMAGLQGEMMKALSKALLPIGPAPK